MTSSEAPVRARLAERTGTAADDWFVVLKARYGMEIVFSALREHDRRGEVVTQALTCATAVNPIIAAGLRPVYADISRSTLSADAAAVTCTSDTAAVVIQHTFGFVPDADSARFAAVARECGAIVVEDCAHGVGRMARGADGAPVADVSIHSFGVEKVLPTKFGGAVWVNPAMADARLRAALAERFAALPQPGLRLRLAMRFYRLHVAVLARLPRAIATPLRSLMAKAGAFEPPIAAAETRASMGRAPVGLAPREAALAGESLGRLGEIETQRSAATAIYAGALGDLGPLGAMASAQPLVRFPLLVPPGVDPERVIALLAADGVAAGRWYRPLLFPGTAVPEAYGLRDVERDLPVTADVSARIVNLPTAVSADRARDIAARTLDAIERASRPAGASQT